MFSLLAAHAGDCWRGCVIAMFCADTLGNLFYGPVCWANFARRGIGAKLLLISALTDENITRCSLAQPHPMSASREVAIPDFRITA